MSQKVKSSLHKKGTAPALPGGGGVLDISLGGEVQPGPLYPV